MEDSGVHLLFKKYCYNNIFLYINDSSLVYHYYIHVELDKFLYLVV